MTNTAQVTEWPEETEAAQLKRQITEYQESLERLTWEHQQVLSGMRQVQDDLRKLWDRYKEVRNES